MTNQPIQREVMRSMLSATRQNLKFLRNESITSYQNGDINLVDHCLNIAVLGEQDFTIYMIIVNFDQFSNEELRNFFNM